MNANGGVAKEAARLNKELKDSEKERKKLEKELARKEKKRKGSCRNGRSPSVEKKSRCDLGGFRGRMISASDREKAIILIKEVVSTGASLAIMVS